MKLFFTIALINIHYLYTEFQTSWNMNIYDIDCNMNIYSWNMNNSNRTRNISKKKEYSNSEYSDWLRLV